MGMLPCYLRYKLLVTYITLDSFLADIKDNNRKDKRNERDCKNPGYPSCRCYQVYPGSRKNDINSKNTCESTNNCAEIECPGRGETAMRKRGAIFAVDN